ncbi:T9SS type A sorting domain-containing protein, partial [bacterium]|nr:T9SS type A sorting domain-containing protein [bacterium]
SLDFSSYGEIEDKPAIVCSSTPFVIPPTTSVLSLWIWDETGFDFAWESGYQYYSDYRHPYLADMDGDGKVSILHVEDDHNQMYDWELTTTGIWEPPEDHHPDHFTLHPVYPNPFNPTTTITFTLPMAGEVDLSVFDISGSRVGGGLAPTRSYPPGTHSIQFDGSNLTSGIYFIRLQAGEFTALQKMVLLK